MTVKPCRRLVCAVPNSGDFPFVGVSERGKDATALSKSRLTLHYGVVIRIDRAWIFSECNCKALKMGGARAARALEPRLA